MCSFFWVSVRVGFDARESLRMLLDVSERRVQAYIYISVINKDGKCRELQRWATSTNNTVFLWTWL